MDTRFLQGNEAVALAALQAGIQFYAGYPITPATEIMELLAEEPARNPRFAYLHFEDEIASINAIVGASLAGAKAMTATSGPGFSLMQEGIGLAHMTRAPIVIVDVQRVGPSTGMPTLPSQGDVMQARYGSHGDFYPIAFSPNSVEEAYAQTIISFNAAEESLSPVVLLMDGYIGHLYEAIDLDAVNIPPVPRSRPPFGQGRRHFTGLLSRDDVPDTKDSAYYREWYAGYKKEIQIVADKYALFETVPNDKSNTIIISYGITSRIVRELGDAYAYFRPIRIWPSLDREIIEACQGHKKVVVIEMNDGQYGGEIERILKRESVSIPVIGGDLSLSQIVATMREKKVYKA
ncbi:hypothetical protein AUK40_06765 [Candidatus Wirthbacteria bacterium CG2_30_54_11]|uniref:Pyruvate flavodoxin/ferredoxin oxidoreductase pyrimidine binding domain-containing protein n=1 Tax=Candidatus Wirthbacteria bacterium CG2_30_54_11 TaxID=1817892 RepID=A0A1J5ICZ5_9BACT|nr:MAG: hypothetical protein AUK40_06765 [Candidatus Wirthbacteria bacterium CG2_30_54_11]